VIEMAAGMNRAMLVAAKLMARPPVLEGRAMPTGMACVVAFAATAVAPAPFSTCPGGPGENENDNGCPDNPFNCLCMHNDPPLKVCFVNFRRCGTLKVYKPVLKVHQICDD
jgi:hypothetical protein